MARLRLELGGLGLTVAEYCPPLPCEHSAIASCTPFDESVNCPALSATVIYSRRSWRKNATQMAAGIVWGLRATGVLEEAAEGAAVETRALLQPACAHGRCQRL